MKANVMKKSRHGTSCDDDESDFCYKHEEDQENQEDYFSKDQEKKEESGS